VRRVGRFNLRYQRALELNKVNKNLGTLFQTLKIAKWDLDTTVVKYWLLKNNSRPFEQQELDILGR